MADVRLEHPLAILSAYSNDAIRPVFSLSIEKVWKSEVNNLNREESPSATLIPEPDGEVGRPGRGGYSLEAKLDWPPGLYQETFTKKAVQDTLDPSKPFTSQDQVQVQAVITKMLAKFPILRRYDNSWASRDFIKGCLKNASRHR
ncbi:hypothetical protein BKA70DRAFT_1237096 [Coprinopsis sp. MPI-PUGE-AT-0042]|nr:hypothetical protein BKA70DRAFT_1237096 [Coprinopsis sp. MPI-PUGE-AT-0042]